MDPEQDPDQFADDNPKCMDYEHIWVFFQGFEPLFGSQDLDPDPHEDEKWDPDSHQIKIRIRIRIRVTSTDPNPHRSDADPQYCNTPTWTCITSPATLCLTLTQTPITKISYALTPSRTFLFFRYSILERNQFFISTLHSHWPTRMENKVIILSMEMTGLGARICGSNRFKVWHFLAHIF